VEVEQVRAKLLGIRREVRTVRARLAFWHRGLLSDVLIDWALAGLLPRKALLYPRNAAGTATANGHRFCGHDRANTGNSDKVPGPLDGKTTVTDLHRLLQAAQIEPPKNLLGASFDERPWRGKPHRRVRQAGSSSASTAGWAM
jgi:hypothetical protein